MSSQKIVREKPIPEGKLNTVKELVEQIKKHKTILVVSSKGLPGKQFHDIKKKLRDKAELRVAKKGLIVRAIDSSGKKSLGELKQQINSDFAIFFSNVDAFELSAILAESQSSRRAKEGDVAPEDINIEPGPTDLVPGPAISELSGVGLKVAVKEGKLEIIKGATVTRKGQVIEAKVAGVLSKLGISPMKVGFLPLAAYDANEDKVYVGIKIDKEEAFEELKESIRKALGFAINVEYLTDKTIRYFITKAAMEEKAISRIVDNQSKKEEA